MNFTKGTNRRSFSDGLAEFITETQEVMATAGAGGGGGLGGPLEKKKIPHLERTLSLNLQHNNKRNNDDPVT